MGALGDRYGRKRMLLVGLALFGGASVVATFAGSTGPLIAARALMGLGAAVITPITLAVVPAIFPPTERAKAVSFVAIGLGLGIPIGPILGGYLLGHFWWGSVFLVNVPVAALAMLAVAVLVPESRDPVARRVDVPGGVLSTAGLVAFVYGVIEAPGRGWGNPVVVGSVAGGLVLLAAFGCWERRTPAPMIDLALFARPRFLWGTLSATLASFALFGLLFVLPQYLQAVGGHDAMGTGVRLLPLMGGLILGARASTALAERLGTRLPVATGLALIGAGLGLGALTGVGSGYGYVATWLTIIGIGVGLTLAPAMDAVLAELPAERAGSGTALTMTLRQVGGALGVALLGSVSAAAYTGRLHLDGLPAPLAAAVRDSVPAGVAVAARLHNGVLLADVRAAYTGRLHLDGLPAPLAAAVRDSVPAGVAVAARLHNGVLLADVRAAYVHAMAVVLVVCAAVVVVGAVMAGRFLPPRPAPVVEPAPVVGPAAPVVGPAASVVGPAPEPVGVDR
jgi:EmrB/QacA subfamily drug resistance transporter